MMNRSERRYFEKEMSKILKYSGDVCGVCGVEFKHNSQTFGGVVAGNCAMLTGECCVHRLDVLVGTGVYIDKNVDGILSVFETAQGGARVSPVDAFSAIKQMRSEIGSLDKASDDPMRQAGVQRSPTNISITDTPWKLDDAAWFQGHPDRSHRLRPVHPGEVATLPAGITKGDVPEAHRWEILVRQVKEGQRIRTVFCRNTKAFIPDVDEVIHAIFDIVVKAEGNGVLSAEDIAMLAAKYHIDKGASCN
ncbi:hypothetical protein [Pseudomonas sp. BE134]|uniref:hypothetical protein n=1 Tax=Pseudomonas sp. BE134 TaxID=2817843 RepID=UPI0028679E00|nr:hypothetical protein [Pseudomonas sp. BE134]MDR6927854.1 hypothetical protein [Pseudomonas sp. BE134]